MPVDFHSFGLTPKQSKLLQLVLGGLTDSAGLAHQLGISSSTVKNHLQQIFAKTGCRSLSALLALALRQSNFGCAQRDAGFHTAEKVAVGVTDSRLYELLATMPAEEPSANICFEYPLTKCDAYELVLDIYPASLSEESWVDCPRIIFLPAGVDANGREDRPSQVCYVKMKSDFYAFRADLQKILRYHLHRDGRFLKPRP